MEEELCQRHQCWYDFGEECPRCIEEANKALDEYDFLYED